MSASLRGAHVRFMTARALQRSVATAMPGHGAATPLMLFTCEAGGRTKRAGLSRAAVQVVSREVV